MLVMAGLYHGKTERVNKVTSIMVALMLSQSALELLMCIVNAKGCCENLYTIIICTKYDKVFCNSVELA